MSNASKESTLGPIENLDEHVPPEWWKHLFDETYLLTDGDVLDQEITKREIERVVEQGALAPSDRILDLCCGHGRHSLELFRRGFTQVEGIDQSSALVDIARRAAQERGAEVPFQVGDARSLPYASQSFDAVLILGNSFGYFEGAEEDDDVLEEVRRVLRPGGRVVLDLTDGDYTRRRFASRSWEWARDDILVCRERELADDGDRLVARELVVHVEDGVQRDQFYAERLYGRREVRRLLQRSGFTASTFAPLRGESTRGEDLGMMDHRFLVTAHVEKPASSDGTDSSNGTESGTPRPGGGADDIRYVAVALGDPDLPDETKLGGEFDEDDYEVIEALREALQSLDEYEFIYLDDHDTLFDDLQVYAEAVDFVFNLCDEGLRNDPRQELHVPALLDTLSTPYTGAGPQCLAQCYDKSMVRGVAREMNIPVADGWFLPSGAPVPSSIPLSFPVIVKPNAADNSVGMTTDCIADAPGELRDTIRSVRSNAGDDRALLIEEFLSGADLTYGVIGNPKTGFRSLPISEDDYSRLPDDLPRFCGYEAKWLPDSPYWTDIEAVPADLPEATRTQIQDHSHALFERLGCQDYARFDWRLDGDGRPHLLEANPNPGWSWDSHLVEAAAFSGLSYPDVLAAILETAYQRMRAQATH